MDFINSNRGETCLCLKFFPTFAIMDKAIRGIRSKTAERFQAISLMVVIKQEI